MNSLLSKSKLSYSPVSSSTGTSNLFKKLEHNNLIHCLFFINLILPPGRRRRFVAAIGRDLIHIYITMNSSAASSSSSTTAGSVLTSRRQRITDRINRAYSHRLVLLHRSETNPASAAFFVLGATGNVYTVTISTTPSCSCPDRINPCKHILFILLRALRLPPDDRLLYRKILLSSDVQRLLSIPTDDSVLAGPRLQERFRQIFIDGSSGAGEDDDGDIGRGRLEVCPVCLEMLEMDEKETVSVCLVCGNGVHTVCFDKWRKSRGRRGANCVMCRAKWKKKKKKAVVDKYVNLEEFIGEDSKEEEEAVVVADHQ